MTLRKGRILSIVAVAIAITVPAGADEVGLDFNADALRAGYTFEREERGMEFDASWLHHSDNGDVGALGFHLGGLAGTSKHPVEAGVGAKFFLIDGETESGVAVGLGGHLRYRFSRLNRLRLDGHLYYAPSALAFSDVNDYLDMGVSAAYLVHERAAVYVGARLVRVDFENTPSIDLDDGLHLGLRLNF